MREKKVAGIFFSKTHRTLKGWWCIPTFIDQLMPSMGMGKAWLRKHQINIQPPAVDGSLETDGTKLIKNNYYH